MDCCEEIKKWGYAVINEDFQERKNEIVNILSYLKYMEKERSTNDSIEKNMEVGDVDFNKLQKTIKSLYTFDAVQFSGVHPHELFEWDSWCYHGIYDTL